MNKIRTVKLSVSGKIRNWISTIAGDIIRDRRDVYTGSNQSLDTQDQRKRYLIALN